jgi:hypothetical protein
VGKVSPLSHAHHALPPPARANDESFDPARGLARRLARLGRAGGAGAGAGGGAGALPERVGLWLGLAVAHALALGVGLALGGGLVLVMTRQPGAPSQAQLGQAVATLVEQRASKPSPAVRAAVDAALAPEPEVDQEAPTRPGNR